MACNQVGDVVFSLFLSILFPVAIDIFGPFSLVLHVFDIIEIMADTKFKLNNGVEIPALGLGTWQSAAGEVEKAVAYALSIGYKHIDGGK